MSQVNASSEALFQYASDLKNFIDRISAKLLELMERHRKAGYIWQDSLYEEFGGTINMLKNGMMKELEELDKLRKTVVSKAIILRGIEEKNKFS